MPNVNAQRLHTRSSFGYEGMLSGSVRALLAAPDLDARLAAPGYFERFQRRLSATLDDAYVGGDSNALEQVHSALYYLYEEEIGPILPGGRQHQYHPFVMRIRSEIERAWERFELQRLQITPDIVPVEPEAFFKFLKAQCSGHRLARHPLFDFLENDADQATLVDFFLNEGIVVLHFCDMIVLSMVGADEEIRCELAGNFWDEVGNGDYQNRHTELYKRLLHYVGEEFPDGRALSDNCLARLNWQGLAGYNIYLYLALHRRNYFKSVGCLGVAEMMDPAQYEKIVRGCYRVGLKDDRQLAYYVDHVEIDKGHGDGWFDNVMGPLIKQYPAAAFDIAAGAIMRLNTGADYYDALLARLAGCAVDQQRHAA